MVAPGPFCSCFASTRRYILACSGAVTKHARLQPQLGPTTGSYWGVGGGWVEPGMTEMLAPASWATLLLGREGVKIASSLAALPQPPPAFSCIPACLIEALFSVTPCPAALKNKCFWKGRGSWATASCLLQEWFSQKWDSLCEWELWCSPRLPCQGNFFFLIF